MMGQLVNDLITIVNNIGLGFCNHAASIFIQSSILIVLLLVVNFLLRKRVRAVFRYCLWMLLFVKLILPSSLALPTGIGYWLGDYWPSKPPVSAQMPVIEPVTPIAVAPAVATEAKAPLMAPVEPIAPTPTVQIQPAEVQLEPISWQGLVLLGWLVGVLIFSALLVQRARFVKGLLAQAKQANGRLLDLLHRCRTDLGVKRQVGLRISANMVSPAVCGLFRPTILLPGYLLKKLDRQKVRAVLIHELAHIKRWDIWVNLFQTVLQIAYFYNPLLWLANAMVRRVREQAVDEMVLVTLDQEAEGYSNTLVDIAEMAFWRPNLSLRLIGVVESKKALTQRIKHIISRPLPKTAKLGLLGLAIVVIAAAVLLPMAKAVSGPPTFTIKGTVTDAETGQPIAGAKVGDHGYGDGKQFGVTGPDGSYNYNSWYEEHAIIATIDGYEAQEKTLNTKLFAREKERTIDFQLKQKKALEPEDKIAQPATQPEIAWGKTVKGVQLGIGFEHNRSSYHQAEVVALRIYARNVTDKPIQYMMSRSLSGSVEISSSLIRISLTGHPSEDGGQERFLDNIVLSRTQGAPNLIRTYKLNLQGQHTDDEHTTRELTVPPGEYKIEMDVSCFMFEKGNKWPGFLFGGIVRTGQREMQVLPDDSTAQPTETLTFGPVIQRVLDGRAQKEFLDFDSGKVFTPPSVLKTDAVTTRNWLRSLGIDLNAWARRTSEGYEWSIFGFELALLPVSERDWDGLSATQVSKSLATAEGAEGARIADLKEDTTVLLRTSKGGMGMLQILGFTDNPPSVKIRYKMVQAAKPGKPLWNLLSSNVKPYNSDRFHQMRQILLGLTLYVQDQNGWPAELTDLKRYLPNQVSISLDQYIFKSPGKVLSVEGKRPILFEKVAGRPDGEFVGFDDTHVEFIKDRQRLEALKVQVGLRPTQPASQSKHLGTLPESSQPSLKSAPILAYDVKLTFAKPKARDGSFHSNQSVAFVIPFVRPKDLPRPVLLGVLSIGQTMWNLVLDESKSNNLTISDGSTGQEISSHRWSANSVRLDMVATLPVRYGKTEYQCPVHIKLTRRKDGPPMGSYWFCAYLSGRLPWGAGGRGFEIVNLDQMMEFRTTGDGTNKMDAVLGIDINGDGKIDSSEKGGERFGLYEPFTIGSKTYRVTEIDPYLPRVVFHEVAAQTAVAQPTTQPAVGLSEKTQKIVGQFKANSASFVLQMDGHREIIKPMTRMRITDIVLRLTAPAALPPTERISPEIHFQISEAQATRIVDALAQQGLFDTASSYTPKPNTSYYYTMDVKAGAVSFQSTMGNAQASSVLKALRSALEGPPANLIDEQLKIIHKEIVGLTAKTEGTPATGPSAKLTFGPVIEREIPSAPTDNKEWLIDFDTGKIISISPEELAKQVPKVEGVNPVLAWYHQTGMDALVRVEEPIHGLGGTELVVVPAKDTDGLNLEPDAVVNSVSGLKPDDGSILRGDTPLIYKFKTREGGIGILQIVGFTEKPKGVKIRYKMVQKAQPATQAVELWKQIAQRKDKELRREALDQVLSMLKDGHSKTQALQTLARVADVPFDREPFLKEVRLAMNDPNAEVRAAALQAIGTVGGGLEDLPTVILLADDKEEQVRAVVARAIYSLDPSGRHKSIAPAIETLLDDKSEVVKRATIRSLWSKPLTPTAEDKLLALSHDGSLGADVVYYALSTRPVVSLSVAHRLIELMDEQNSRAHWGLTHHRAAADARDVVVRALIRNLDETLDGGARVACIWALSQHGGSEAIAKLKELAADDEEHESIRQEAVKSLRRLGQAGLN